MTATSMGDKPKKSAPLWQLGLLAALAGLLLVSRLIYLPEWFLIPALTAVGITLLIARTYWAYSQPMDPKAEQAQLRQRIVNGLKSKND